MSHLKSYRACFVPMCTNTTKRTPYKMFFNVPREAERRNKWFQAVGRECSQTTSHYFCCEDHFNLVDDMENYLYHTTMGSRRAQIKIGVIPHKFLCQPFRQALENKQSQHVAQEILSESPNNIEEVNDNLQAPMIEAVSVNSFEFVEVDGGPLNIIKSENVSVETQTDIESHAVGVQVKSHPEYRSVSVQCNISSMNKKRKCDNCGHV